MQNHDFIWVVDSSLHTVFAGMFAMGLENRDFIWIDASQQLDE